MDPAADLTLRTAFALLFAVAASHKVRDPARFRATLADYRLLPAPFVWPAAMLTIGAELAVAVVLFVSSWRAPGPLTAAALLCVYAVAMAINLARGRRHLDCGCAGPAHRQPISGGLVVRNALLAATVLVAVVPVRPRPLLWVDALTVTAATATLAALYASLDRLLAQAPALARLRGAA